MMPIPNDYRDIVDTLSSATDNGRVKWLAARFGFEVIVLGSRFVIWVGTDEESGLGFVSFALSDEKGKILDTWYVDESEAEYDFMQRLYAGAKRQSLGISKILSELKSVIEKGGTIGENPPIDDAPPF